MIVVKNLNTFNLWNSLNVNGPKLPGGPQPPILREVMVPILNNADCERMYERAGQIQHIPHIFVCAGYQEGGKDSCDGDSGGPLVTRRSDGRFQLSGVVSWGVNCGERNQPGVYTRISAFRDWINQVLKTR